MPRSVVITSALAGTLVLLCAREVEGQARQFVLAPEYAGDVETIRGRPHWGVSVQTFTARFSMNPWNRLSPWVTTGIVVLDPRCVEGTDCLEDETGWLLIAGARADLLSPRRPSAIRPYLHAGLGAAAMNRGSVTLLPSGGVGARWAERGAISPRLEARWERYEGRVVTMAGVGVGFVLGRPVTASGR